MPSDVEAGSENQGVHDLLWGVSAGCQVIQSREFVLRHIAPILGKYVVPGVRIRGDLDVGTQTHCSEDEFSVCLAVIAGVIH